MVMAIQSLAVTPTRVHFHHARVQAPVRVAAALQKRAHVCGGTRALGASGFRGRRTQKKLELNLACSAAQSSDDTIPSLATLAPARLQVQHSASCPGLSMY